MKRLSYIFAYLLLLLMISCSEVSLPPNQNDLSNPIIPPTDAVMTTVVQDMMVAVEDCVEEVCDALDNDCDGKVDEDKFCPCSPDNSCYAGPPETRGIGLCADGERMCVDNDEYWGECRSSVGPTDEVCDGGDNDCDGQVDENTQNACGQCGEAPTEICDGTDNDCDGQTDEGVHNSCGTCGETPEEVCDEVDNDCDGSTDEGVLNECGACGAVGAELCDGNDNDCDGNTDENVLNACGSCGAVGDEVCDGGDNDCDGNTDEGVLNACGQCGNVPAEVCDGMDNDCDGRTDEGALNACGTCGDVPVEICDRVDNDCDGNTDEGVLNACGDCGDAPEEVCDLIDNDCDNVVDEQGCVVTDIDIDDDCVTVSCPRQAPYPIACEINFRGRDPRGCVAHRRGERSVYLQEGNDCGSGRVTGRLVCSNIQGDDLNEMNCPINKEEASYPNRPNGCADTD